MRPFMRFALGVNVTLLAWNSYAHTWPGAVVSAICVVFLLVVAP